MLQLQDLNGLLSNAPYSKRIHMALSHTLCLRDNSFRHVRQHSLILLVLNYVWLASGVLQYVGVLPFFINVEMPTTSRQGEQVGIRVTVFNYMPAPIEATVVLAGSRDYKFVHVGINGIVSSHVLL